MLKMGLASICNVRKVLLRNRVFILIFLGTLTFLSGFRIKSYVEAQWNNQHKNLASRFAVKLERSVLDFASESIIVETESSDEDKSRYTTTKSMRPSSTKKRKTIKSKVIPRDKKVDLPLCSHKSKLLGRKDFVMPEDTPKLKDTEKANPLVLDGGHFKPKDCKSKWKVAILIPFRNRDIHLYHFLHHMHPLFQRQQLDYRIYIINQFGNSTFNRGKLINIGFTEMKKDYDYDCVVLHDVDLLLENDHAMYQCLPVPLHLVSAMQKHNYTITYEQYFGGVTEFTTKQFQKINGFSNNFWGWGGEDDELLLRVRKIKKMPTRYPAEIARYFMIFHERDEGNEKNPQRYDNLLERFNSTEADGLNTLKYQMWKVEAEYKLEPPKKHS